jgi:uncharacterized protein (TIGR03083 family)
MHPADYIAHIRADGARLADVADGHLDAQVPSCPEWTVADLVDHVGQVHWFWRQIAGRRAQEVPELNRPEVPTGDALVPWLRDEVAQVTQVLDDADPAAPVWTWTGQQDDIGWIQRRMAQETAVHRWDGEAAVGSTTPIDAALAVDGIDEFFDVMLPNNATASPGINGTVHLHCTDIDGEWLVTMDDGNLSVAREHGKGDAAVRGSSSDLLLLLWRRVPPDQLELFGDRATLDRFLAVVELD